MKSASFKGAAVLVGAKLTGRVSDLLAKMAIEHNYTNPTEDDIEAVYTFPMPAEAVLSDVSLEMNGIPMRGQVREKNVASQTYEEAVEEGHTAVIVERAGPGLFTASLGNLKPGEAAVIRYEWIMPIRVVDETVRLSVPTMVQDRYGHAEGEGGLAPHQTTQQSALVEYPFAVEVVFEGRVAQGQIGCPSHESARVESDAETKVLRIQDGAFLDRDLTVLINGVNTIEAAIQTQAGEECFLFASVPARIPAPTCPAAIKILIDCSGSMEGESISHARDAAVALVTSLSSSDYASLSVFGSCTEHLIEEMSPMGKGESHAMRRLIASLKADRGGTELEEAMLKTLRGIKTPVDSAPACVLLITDGASWNHRRVVRAAQESGQRVFCIGVGASPAESLVHELALYTGGAYELLGENEPLVPTVERLLSRIRQSGRATAVAEWGRPAPLWSSLPSRCVYAGEQLHIFARLKKPLQEICAVTFTFDGGKQVSSPAIAVQTVEGPALTKLVATHEMMGATGAIAHSLALAHGLISESTSLVIVNERNPDDRALGLPRLAKIEQMAVFRAAASRPIRAADSSAPAALFCAAPRDAILLRREIGGAMMDKLDIPAFLREAEPDEKSELGRALAWAAERVRDVFGPLVFELRARGLGRKLVGAERAIFLFNEAIKQTGDIELARALVLDQAELRPSLLRKIYEVPGLTPEQAFALFMFSLNRIEPRLSDRALACLETVKFEFSLVNLVDRPPELLGRFSEFAKKFDYDAREAAAQARAG